MTTSIEIYWITMSFLNLKIGGQLSNHKLHTIQQIGNYHVMQQFERINMGNILQLINNSNTSNVTKIKRKYLYSRNWIFFFFFGMLFK